MQKLLSQMKPLIALSILTLALTVTLPPTEPPDPVIPGSTEQNGNTNENNEGENQENNSPGNSGAENTGNENNSDVSPYSDFGTNPPPNKK